MIADAGVVLCLRQVQRLLILSDRLGEELDQGVLSANLEIEIGQVGLFDEAFVFQIRRTDLGVVLRLVYLAADSAKQVRGPGNVQWQRVDLGVFAGVETGTRIEISGGLPPGVRRAKAHRGEVQGTRFTNQGTGFHVILKVKL